MNFLQRAYYYLTRKVGKVVLLLLVFTIISTLILTCISIYTSIQNKAIDIRQAFSTSFTINAKQVEGGLSQENIQEIIKVDNVKDEYVLRSYSLANSLKQDDSPLELEKNNLPVSDEVENSSKIVGISDSEKDTYFSEAGFEIIEGTHLENNTKNGVLIHETIAKNNQLKINDYIKVKMIGNDKFETVKIIGIFSNTRQQEGRESTPQYDLYENVIFIDCYTFSSLDDEVDQLHTQYADFMINDPEFIDDTIEEIQGISSFDWNKSVITKQDSSYQHARDSLIQLQTTTLFAITTILLVSTLLLLLILRLWIKDRKKEIGILLSMGISKKSIILQLLVEILAITVLGIVLSLFLSIAFAQIVESTLTKSVGSSVNSDIPIQITINEWILTLLIGISVSLITIAISSSTIMKLKPKHILTSLE